MDKDHQYIFLYRALYEYWTSKRRSSAASPTLSRLSVEEEVQEEPDDSLHLTYDANSQFQGFPFND